MATARRAWPTFWEKTRWNIYELHHILSWYRRGKYWNILCPYSEFRALISPLISATTPAGWSQDLSRVGGKHFLPKKKDCGNLEVLWLYTYLYRYLQLTDIHRHVCLPSVWNETQSFTDDLVGFTVRWQRQWLCCYLAEKKLGSLSVTANTRQRGLFPPMGNGEQMLWTHSNVIGNGFFSLLCPSTTFRVVNSDRENLFCSKQNGEKRTLKQTNGIIASVVILSLFSASLNISVRIYLFILLILNRKILSEVEGGKS